MNSRINMFTIVVRDYDEAIYFYTTKMGFLLLEDTVMSPEKRWVRVAPMGQNSCAILLAKAKNDTELQAVGNQTGGRVGFFLQVGDFWQIYNHMTRHGVVVVREPSVESYGTVAVVEDLYGNLWDIIEPSLEL